MGFKMAAAAENLAGRTGLRFWFSFLLELDGGGCLKSLYGTGPFSE